MKQWKYLDEGMKITLYRYRQKNMEEFFTMKGTLVACKGVDGLFKALTLKLLAPTTMGARINP